MSVYDFLMANKNIKKVIQDKIDDVFLNSEKFSMEIEKLVAQENDLNYIDAVILYCQEKEIELDTIKKLITKQLKKKIELDAMNLNYLRKKAPNKLNII